MYLKNQLIMVKYTAKALHASYERMFRKYWNAYHKHIVLKKDIQTFRIVLLLDEMQINLRSVKLAPDKTTRRNS